MGFILRLRIDFEVILSGAVVTITSFLAVGLAPKAVSLPRTTLQGGCMRSFRNKTKESWDIVESHRKWGHTPWGTPGTPPGRFVLGNVRRKTKFLSVARP